MYEERSPLVALENLKNSLTNFDEAMIVAVKISERAIGIDHTGRQNRALYLFGKLIAHCMSIMNITSTGLPEPQGIGLLDHSSVAALGRVVVDCSVMIMYISEPSLTSDEWKLRLNVLYLHELLNRKRSLTSLSGDSISELPFFARYEDSKIEIKSEIAQLGERLGRGDTLSDLLSGQKVFLDGARGAAREAGWDINKYEFYQSYLSNWVHSHPVSFMRADEQELSFSYPSPFQLDFCSTVLEMATAIVSSVTKRMESFSGSRARDPLH